MRNRYLKASRIMALLLFVALLVVSQTNKVSAAATVNSTIGIWSAMANPQLYANSAITGGAGVYVVVAVSTHPSATISSVTDVAGSSYSLITTAEANFAKAWVYIAQLSGSFAGGANCISINSGGNSADACALVIRGLSANPMDVSAIGSNNWSTDMSTASVTPNTSSSVLIASFGWSSNGLTTTPGAGWAKQRESGCLVMQTQTVGSGTFPSSATLSGVDRWAGVLIALKVQPPQSPTNITLSNNTIAAGSPIGTAVGNLTATDPDEGETYTYTLVAGEGSTHNASFTIVGNELRTGAILAGGTYSIRVNVNDGTFNYEKILIVYASPYPLITGGYTDDNDFITNVTFSGINNTTGNDHGYANYSSESASVSAGTSYNLSCSINVGDGSYPAVVVAWFDWNQNNSFDDAGEKYVIGTGLSETGANTCNTDIAVPANAVAGTTIMRIAMNSNDGSTEPPNSGGDSFYGEAEDYSVAIAGATEINLKQGLGSIADGGTFDFGSKTVSSTTDIEFTIENTGSEELTVTTPITITGANQDQFSIQSQPNESIAGSGTATFTVRFAPSSTGPKTATISIGNSDANENPYDLTITGTGTLPEINLKQGENAIADGGSYDFGDKNVSTTNDIIFTIENSGNENLTLTTPITVGGADSDQFSIQAQPATPVAGPGSATFTVRFAPTSFGPKTATIAIANNDSDENPYNLTITGTGITPEIALKQGENAIADGGTYDFSGHVLATNTDVVFTIENNGTADLTIATPLSLGGANQDQFTITSQPSATVVPTASTTFTVRFTPTTVGAKTASISFVCNDLDENPTDLVLTGSGVSHTLSAGALADFGNVCLNAIAGSNSFTITGTDLTAENVTVGPLAGFTFSTTAGGTYTSSLDIVQAGGAFSQDVYVKFTPTLVQSYNGNIALAGGGAPSINVAATASGIARPTPVIDGNTNVNEGSVGNVYSTAVGMSNYSWEVSDGGTISAGGGVNDNSVTVTWNGAGNQYVRVNYDAINGCPAESATEKAVDVVPTTVYLSNDYTGATPGFGVTRFNDLALAIANSAANSTIHVENYTHVGNLNVDDNTFIIDDGDLTVSGTITATTGQIRAIGTGYLVQSPTANVAKVYPLTDGTHNYTLSVNCGNAPSQAVKVRINNNKDVDGAAVIDFWDISAEAGLDATLVLRVPKSAINSGSLGRTTVIRYFKGGRYIPIAQDKVTVQDKGSYYDLTLTGLNEF